MESSNLIVGIDFTKSNEWTGSYFHEIYVLKNKKIIIKLKFCDGWFLSENLGARSFNRKSLHTIGNGPNPYEQAISIIGKTLSAFDDDNLIPCFGFGDGNFVVTQVARGVH